MGSLPCRYLSLSSRSSREVLVQRILLVQSLPPGQESGSRSSDRHVFFLGIFS